MSQDRGNYKGRRNCHSYNKNRKQINIGDKGKEILESINENNPVIKQFQEYAAELDSKNDRYERIVKISRDITIESKRIIFLLHTLDKETKRNSVLGEAETRLNNLINISFKNIACELQDEDPYLYLRAFRSGFQEFVEALTFYWYLQNNTLYNWTKLVESMTYTINSSQTNNDQTSIEQKQIKCLVEPLEYILGIADLTGELMRKCINNLASGDIANCFETCNFVREIYKGFLSCIGISRREVAMKLSTLKQSLMKMENVCYIIKVRGSEIPKHMLVDVAIVSSEEMNVNEDEGYQVY